MHGLDVDREPIAFAAAGLVQLCGDGDEVRALWLGRQKFQDPQRLFNRTAQFRLPGSSLVILVKARGVEDNDPQRVNRSKMERHT